MRINLNKPMNDLFKLDNLKLFEVIELKPFINQLQEELVKRKDPHFEYRSKSWLLNNIRRKGIFSSKSSINMIYDSRLYQNSTEIHFGCGHKWMLIVVTDKGMVFSKCSVSSDKSEFSEQLYWNNIHLKVSENSKIEINLPNPTKKLEFGILYKGVNTFYDLLYKSVDEKVRKSEHFIKLKRVSKLNEKDKLNTLKIDLLKPYDKDGNGKINLIEDSNTFEILLSKNNEVIQRKSLSSNKNYVHEFVKLSNYIDSKKHNLQRIFLLTKKSTSEKDLKDLINTLNLEVKLYNLLVFNSLNLLVSLLDDDIFTFYKIYEKLDELNIFNSNWENQVTQKLDSINKGLNELIFEIRQMSLSIIESISDLTYVTEKTNRSLEHHLKEIDSSIQSNNLLTLVNTYQLYKINKNTKSS